MRYQVISRDYNGTTMILATEDDLSTAITRIRAEVTDANFNNALTTDNKFRSIEAYFPQFVNSAGELQDDVVYAGDAPNGSRRVLAGGSIQVLSEDTEARFYIGKNEGEHFFLEDQRNNEVSDWGSEYLQDKTFFFIKALA